MISQEQHHGGWREVSISQPLIVDPEVDRCYGITPTIPGTEVRLPDARRYRPGAPLIAVFNRGPHSIAIKDYGGTGTIGTVASGDLVEIGLIDNSSEDGSWFVQANAFAAAPSPTAAPRFYLAGGRAAPQANYEHTHDTDSWLTRSALPANGLSDCAGAALAGNGHIFGRGRIGNVLPRSHEAYTPIGDAWQSLPASASIEVGHSAWALDAKAYRAGGTNQGGATEEYDPTPQTWAAKTAAPNHPYLHGAGNIGNFGYTLGRDLPGLGNTWAHLRYQAAIDTWITRAIPSTYVRARATAWGMGGSLHLVGGRSRLDGSRVDTHEAYSPGGDSWATLAAIATGGREGAASSDVGGIGYVAAGSRTGLAAGALGDLAAFDPTPATWATKATMPGAQDRVTQHGRALAR